LVWCSSAGGNLIVTPPMNVTVEEGSRAELECLPKEADAVVAWFREGAPLPPEMAARAELPANGSLVLRSAHSADLGEYECRVRDTAGRTQASSAFLDVQCLYSHTYSHFIATYLPNTYYVVSSPHHFVSRCFC
jgi:hypothetical protein